jgi:hypothetical protein
MKLYRALTALICVAALAGCEKNGVQEIAAPATGGNIHFFNFGVNAPSVNFYANDTKMTAIFSGTGTEATTGVAYGGVGASGLYTSIAPGSYTLAGKISATVDKDLAIAKATSTIADGKYYSFYMSGFYDASAKSVDAFVIEDNFSTTTVYTVAYVRFVNTISNSSPMTLYAKDQSTLAEVPLGAAVPYKSAGAFTAIPTGSYDLSARVTGSATNTIARTGTGFLAGHVYTIAARGDITVTSTTAASRPVLDITANR